MAQLNPQNLFQSWALTKEEEVIGAVLTTLQKQLIQNQIAEAAQEKVGLTFDPLNPQKFIQQEAELQGRIRALQYLISASEDAESQLNSR